MKHIESRLRLATGIILALYVAQHLINHAFGIVSIEAAEAYRQTVGTLFQNLPGQVLLYGSLLFPAPLALRSIYRRSSLRMSLWQFLQLLLGRSILPLVVGHAVANRGYDLLGVIEDFTPKFVKRYAHIGQEMTRAISDYVSDVKDGKFPDNDHSYS